MFEQERARVIADFEATAREHGGALESGWTEQLHAVEALATIFYTSEEVTRDEFARASRIMLPRHDSIRALEWVPRITAAERATYVDRARREYPDFELREYASDGELQPAPRREVHFPIHYVEPLESNRQVLGLDPRRNEVRNEALREAMYSGALTVSRSTTLVQDAPSGRALLVFAPVYDHTRPADTPAARERALEGLAEGVFMIDALVSDALQTTDSQGLSVEVMATGDGAPVSIATYQPEGGEDATWYAWGAPGTFTWDWSAGGRGFRALITPTGLPYAYDLRAPLALFILALFLTAAVVAVVGLLMQRERRIRLLADLRSDQLHHQATHDSLTGLMNRGAFELRLDEALNSAQRDHTTYSLCYMDLDEFKVVNDIHGYQAGDDLLCQIVGRLAVHMREGDVFARLGGDELGVLMANCRADMAWRIACHLQQVVNDYRFRYEDHTVAVGVSIGVTEINAHTQSVDTALGQADAACNIAKEQGRNRVHVFRSGDSVSDQYRSQMLWAAELRQALDNDRLELHGQRIAPIRGQDGGDMLEVLVRLRDRNGEIVPPGAFIPASERYGLMSELDRWVLERALVLKSRGEQGIWCINLSGHSIGEDGLFDYIHRRLEHHRVSPGEICFEITETAVVRSLSRAERFVSQLRELGCLVALDDFGSGMSSFTYLKHLPVDILKIDGSFVRSITSSRMDRAMVHAIQQIALELGIRTIAEYVENELALTEIRGLGVHYAQGFHVGRPEPIELSRRQEGGAASSTPRN